MSSCCYGQVQINKVIQLKSISARLSTLNQALFFMVGYSGKQESTLLEKLTVNIGGRKQMMISDSCEAVKKTI